MALLGGEKEERRVIEKHTKREKLKKGKEYGVTQSRDESEVYYWLIDELILMACQIV